jgi:hypothetical protein
MLLTTSRFNRPESHLIAARRRVVTNSDGKNPTATESRVTFLPRSDSSNDRIFGQKRNTLVIEKKVTAAALAGAVVTIAIWILHMFDVEVPAEVAAAITTVLAAVAGYLAPHTYRPDLVPAAASTGDEPAGP